MGARKKTLEWPDTLLKAQPAWNEHNLVLLPDTEWEPAGREREVLDQLHSADVAYGLFDAEDLRTWGTVEISEKVLRLCEKPQLSLPRHRAWGFFAFRRSAGQALCEALLASTQDRQIKSLPLKATALDLKTFSDLTRVQAL